MSETVTFKGKPMNLAGQLVKEGQSAPNVEFIGKNLQPVKLSSFKGKTLLILSVPSLDTEVCSRETKKFNEEVSKLGKDFAAICVSMDLPFAQARWCGVENVENVVTLSDYKTHAFGKQFGVFIPDLGLLARAVFLIDPDMTIKYVELVKEITDEPDYAKALHAVSNTMAGS